MHRGAGAETQPYSVVSAVSARSLGLLTLPASFPHVETAENAKKTSAGKRGERAQQKEPPEWAK